MNSTEQRSVLKTRPGRGLRPMTKACRAEKRTLGVAPTSARDELEQRRRRVQKIGPQINTARQSRNQSGAGFQACCVAGFQTRSPHDGGTGADLEIGDTAGWKPALRQGVASPKNLRRKTKLSWIAMQMNADAEQIKPAAYAGQRLILACRRRVLSAFISVHLRFQVQFIRL